MNILIEIGHPAHVLKFSAAIKILEENNHKIFVVTKNIVEQLVGQPFRNVCPPILTPEELEQRIKNSEIQKKGNLKFYRYNNKYYQSDDNGNLLKDKHWNYIKYDKVDDFYDGLARCKINNKGWNCINENGEIISPNQWFNFISDFIE